MTTQPTGRALLAERLRALANTGKHKEAIPLLDEIDIASEQDAKILYYAGVCLGAVDRRDRAVEALRRAARFGFDPFWCAYHLGIIELRARKPLNACHHLTVALVRQPQKSDIYPLLDRIAPNLDLAPLRAAQAGTKGAEAASAAFELGVAEQPSGAGNLGRAVHYFTLALILDPEHEQARSRLQTLMPDLFFDLMPAAKEQATAQIADQTPGPAGELHKLLVRHYDECSRIWQNTLGDDEKIRISRLCLIMAARLSFSSADLKRRIFRDAEQFGVHFLPVHFYSPVPSLTEIDQSVYEHRYDTIPGLRIDRDSHLEWLTRLAAFANELERFPDEAPASGESFYWKNPAFGVGDSSTYYTLIRELKPARVIEVGAGYSSLIALEALKVNGGGSLTCIEPYPLPHLRRLAERGDIRLIESRLQDVPLDVFSALGEDDILFIDSSHVCKIGSDVNHAIFRIMPMLRAGVFCHFHDMFFPYEFLKYWAEDLQLFWNEQYLVMAFLAFNAKFKIEIANQFIAREVRDTFRTRFPKLPAHFSAGGGSLWLRVLSDGSTQGSTDAAVDSGKRDAVGAGSGPAIAAPAADAPPGDQQPGAADADLLAIRRRLAGLENAVAARKPNAVPEWQRPRWYESGVQLALGKLLRPGDLAFDLGANIGVIAAMIGAAVGPYGRVVAFEASPRSIPQLHANLNYSNAFNVQVVHAAVAERSGDLLPIYYAGATNADRLFSDKPRDPDAFVPSIALDDYVERLGVAPRVVKIDIEGAELLALKGFRRTLAQHHPALIVETISTDLELDEFLHSFGYTLCVDANSWAPFDKRKVAASILLNLVYLHQDEDRIAPFRLTNRIEVGRIEAGDFRKSDDRLQIDIGNRPAGFYVLHLDYSPAAAEIHDVLELNLGDTDRPLAIHIAPLGHLARANKEIAFELAQERRVSLRFSRISPDLIRDVLPAVWLERLGS